MNGERILRNELARLLEASGVSRRDFLLGGGFLASSVAFSSLLSGCLAGIELTAVNSSPLTLDSSQTYYLLDSTKFASFGGWRLETQFFERLGSACLLGDSFQRDGDPALVCLNIEKEGIYRVLVHCRNWDTRYSPGRFTVSIDGTPLGRTLGASRSPAWGWEEAGQKQLTAGTSELRFQDLTGEFGRFNAVLLTTDKNLLPPAGKEGLAELREKLAGTTGLVDPKDLGTYDFVVVGGGMGGCCAALAAARNGLKVALLQNRPVLGGNASNEIGVYVATAGSENANGQETGLVEEIAQRCYRVHGGRLSNGWQEALAAVCAEERNLSIFHNVECTGAVMASSSQIKGVVATNILTGERLAVFAKLFADCTGDGGLGYAAGAPFRLGREARQEYLEDLAPSGTDPFTSGSTLPYYVQQMEDEQPFVAPKWAHYFDQSKLPHRPVNGPGPWWWIEYGGRQGTITNAEEIRDELLRIIHGLWDYIKNRSPYAGIAKNYKLVLLPVVGKRESRRLVGDYILKESDIRNGVYFEDAVGYGGWPIDLHAIDGIYDPAVPSQFTHVDLYNIPFRSLYSKTVDNLLMAGRNLSASHVALGSTRIMGTCSVLGQAVGTAAVLCQKYGTDPRGVGSVHIGRLQQMLLRDDAYIIGVRNEDPQDKARSATVTASSTWQTDADYSPPNVINGVARPVGSSPNMWASDPSQHLPQWLQLDLGKAISVNIVQIAYDTNLNHRSGDVNVTVRDYEVQARINGNWLTVSQGRANYQRLNRHEFNAVSTDAIRILVHATLGCPSARIFEVRIYGL